MTASLWYVENQTQYVQEFYTCWLMESLTEEGTQLGSGDEEPDEDDRVVMSVLQRKKKLFCLTLKLHCIMFFTK